MLSDCSTVFSAALKKTWSILFRPLTPTVSRPIDAAWYSFTFISAAYEPDMIYAVPLTSLSPSSSLSALTPFFHSFIPSSRLCAPLHTFDLCLTVLLFLFSPSPLLTPLCLALQSSLSNGDKGRPADYLSNGKKRKADEKEFMTDYVSHFHNTVKCLSNWRKVSPNSACPHQIKPVVSELWTLETCSPFRP